VNGDFSLLQLIYYLCLSFLQENTEVLNVD
jgi:hypothetical protein